MAYGRRFSQTERCARNDCDRVVKTLEVGDA